MPASSKARTSRAVSRPYVRRSPTASPARTEQQLVLHDLYLAAEMSPNTAEPSPSIPDRPGLPTYAAYKRIEARYLQSLSPRKRDKALITQAMFDKIWDVLHQPDACTIETPQFRFWVRKMFTLSRPVWVEGALDSGTGTEACLKLRYPGDDAEDEAEAESLALERALGIGGADSAADGPAYHLFSAVVLHENRPVAIMEQLYELFCFCHVRAGHGGRDKTCAVIREHYSWVPKELTAQFVKTCPTCAVKRGGSVPGMPSVGVDVADVPKRTGKREKKTTNTAASPVAHQWPPTGGPLDPANPEPCGLRERRSSPASPPVSLEGCFLMQADASPSGLFGLPQSQPFAVERHSGGGSPPRTGIGLPSLASALSNEYLVHLNLSPTGFGRDAGECVLPSVLKPLRLSGPCIPGPSSPASSGSSSSSSLSRHRDRSLSSSGEVHPRPCPIDPTLLSFDCLGFARDPDPLELPSAFALSGLNTMFPMPRGINISSPDPSTADPMGVYEDFEMADESGLYRPQTVRIVSPLDDGPGPRHSRGCLQGHRSGSAPSLDGTSKCTITLVAGEPAVEPSTIVRQCSSSSPSSPLSLSPPRRRLPSSPYARVPWDNGQETTPFDMVCSYSSRRRSARRVVKEHQDTSTLSPLAIMTDA